LRLSHHSKTYNLLSENRLQNIETKRDRVDHWVARLEETTAWGQVTWGDAIRREAAARGTSARDGGGLGALPVPEEFRTEPATVREEALYRIAYAGYLEREQRQIEKLSGIEQVRIPADFDFLTIRGLRHESALKLAEFKPYTLGQASRISGVNPADISVLMVMIEAGGGRSA
jgi:tRNA uridine 5-carboxymethylaminomethyl modification enzyme